MSFIASLIFDELIPQIRSKTMKCKLAAFHGLSDLANLTPGLIFGNKELIS